MPLTVGEALRTLPVLSSAQVVAGKDGLERSIRWTHIVDHAEVLSWVRQGDLLLTTAFALKDNPQSELVMIERLVEKGLAGMLISIGRYIRQIPDETAAAADALGFPLIIIPWEVPLVEVTHAIHERIIHEQYALTEQAYHIHNVLSQLVLEGGGLESLAQRLSELLDCSVTIEDAALHLQAFASREPMDEVRRRSIAEGATPQEVTAHLAASGLFEQLKQDPKPRHIAPNPTLGMTLERIIAPVLVGDDLYGYIWIIASQRAFTELDSLAIERAAHIAALILNREQSIYAAEQRLKARLFENLMDPTGVYNPFQLREFMRQFGLHGEYQLAILEEQPTGFARMPQLSRLVENALQEASQPGAVLEWNQRLVLILTSGAGTSPVTFVEDLLKTCMLNGYHINAGISTPAIEADHARRCYKEAIEALQLGSSLVPQRGHTWSYEKLGFLPGLLALPEEMRLNNRYHSMVRQVAAQDQLTGSQLLKTLEVYLDAHLNASQTAQTLFIHRNTLLKRLNKLQGICELELEDPLFVLNLQIAIKNWHFSHPA